METQTRLPSRGRPGREVPNLQSGARSGEADEIWIIGTNERGNVNESPVRN